MELDINTLTEEQKYQLTLGYNIYINEKGKLVTEEPVTKTPEYIAYKTNIINKEFQDSIDKLVQEYTKAEREMFTTQVKHADEYLSTNIVSDFLSRIKRNDETIDELVVKIKTNEAALELASADLLKIKREKLLALNS